MRINISLVSSCRKIQVCRICCNRKMGVCIDGGRSLACCCSVHMDMAKDRIRSYLFCELRHRKDRKLLSSSRCCTMEHFHKWQPPERRGLKQSEKYKRLCKCPLESNMDQKIIKTYSEFGHVAKLAAVDVLLVIFKPQ